MQKSELKSRHTVFYKFLAVNIIVLTVFYGMTLYINGRIISSKEQDIYRSSMNKLELFLNKVDNDVRRQQQIQYQFAEHYDLQKLSLAGNRLSDYDKISIIMRLQSDVVTYMLLCEYCDNITVSIPSVNRTISVKPILDYFEGNIDYQDRTLDISQLFYADGQLYSLFYPAIPANPDAEPLFLVRMNIAKARITADMKTYFNESGEGALLLDRDGSWSLTSTSGNIDELKQYFIENRDTLAGQVESLVKLPLAGSTMWVVYRYSDVMDAFFVSYRPERILTETLTSTKITIWVVSAVALLMVLLSIFWIRRFFADPMSQLMTALSHVEKGNLKINIQYDRDDEFHYVYEQFNSMVKELNLLIEQNYEQRIRAQQAELKQLQYHIKPHFLYNSIFLIYRMASDGDLDTIKEFSLTLGHYYRYITRIQQQTIPLERELDHVRDYVKIQTIRFGDRIRVSMDQTPAGLENQPVLPLMLQPVVENAYHHGLESIEDHGVIDIRMAVSQGFFMFTVDDNGRGLSLEELAALKERIMDNQVAAANSGLSNVHHRLRIHFGADSGLDLEQSPLGGLRVKLIMKLGGDRA